MRTVKKILPRFIKKYISNYYARIKYDVKFGKHAGADLKTYFEGKNYINDYSNVSHSYIGLGTYIAGHTSFSKVKIGRFCSIGKNIKTNIGIHPTDLISSHPAFFSIKKQAGFTFVDKNKFNEHKYADEDKKYLVIIGNDVWIGNNVIIMDGIKIGDGAIIGTSAIVTKDVEPYSVMGGVPAKLIRKRFDTDVIDALLEFKWWEMDFYWIERHHELFLQPDRFVTFIKSSKK